MLCPLFFHNIIKEIQRSKGHSQEMSKKYNCRNDRNSLRKLDSLDTLTRKPINFE